MLGRENVRKHGDKRSTVPFPHRCLTAATQRLGIALAVFMQVGYGVSLIIYTKKKKKKKRGNQRSGCLRVSHTDPFAGALS